MEEFDVGIIGAGPAGMTSAIYALRGNLKVLVLDRQAPGGKVILTSEIENWPGIAKIDGPTLAYNMFEQILNLGATYKYGTVSDIQIRKNDKIVICDDNKYKCKCVIVTTGTLNKKLEVENSVRFEGKGISYCAVCDAKLFSDKTIAVVGGGDSAFKEALYLSKYAKSIYLIHRRDTFRAGEDLINKVLNTENIIINTPYIVSGINGKEKIESIKITNQVTDKEEMIQVDGIFPFIGSLPATTFLKNLNILNEFGYVKVNENMETIIPGLYAAGDVIEKNLRQIVTACNDGAIAGQNAIEYIHNLND